MKAHPSSDRLDLIVPSFAVWSRSSTSRDSLFTFTFALTGGSNTAGEKRGPSFSVLTTGLRKFPRSCSQVLSTSCASVPFVAKERDLERLRHVSILNEFLDEGFGILMEAPKSFADHVFSNAKSMGVDLHTRSGHVPDTKMRLLLMDEYFVIAEGFTIDRINTSEPVIR